ncbi:MULTISPECIES: XRE family transcriptional regulator [unclassified Variovorax]|jgi:SOS-response transcriptional repressor LexA|nr:MULTISPECIES: XRE family transcriptional regulator [unclassified Variovorax]
MESIGTRAKAARKFAKMTQKQAEAASGVKQSSISKIERGDTTRSMSVLALARVYRVDPNWLDTGDGPAPGESHLRLAHDSAKEPHGSYRVLHFPPMGPSFNPRTPNTVPLITWEEAAAWQDRTASQQTQPEQWIPCIAHHSLDTYALRIRGDSMTADSGFLKSYRAGSIVFVDTQLKTPDDGERVIARIDETGEVTCKVFKNEDGRRWLLPLNLKHEPIRLAFTVLGTVVGKWEDED